VTSSSWLDFGGDLNYDAYTGKFEQNFYHCIGQFLWIWGIFKYFADNARSRAG